MGKSIFEFADKFGYDSPLQENWAEVAFEKYDEPPKIISIDVVKNNFNSIVLGQEDKNRRKVSNIISASVFININGYADKVEVVFENKIFIALKNYSLAGTYKVDMDFVIPPPFLYKDYNLTIKIYDLNTKKMADSKIIKVNVNLDGVIAGQDLGVNGIHKYLISTIEYHTYSDGQIEKHIPKNYDNEIKKGKMKYFYHDIYGKQYFLAEVDFHFVEKRKNGIKIDEIPNNYIKTYSYPKGGNAQTGYLYSNNDIIVFGTKYGIRKYPIDRGFVQLIRMPDTLKIKEPNLKIFYGFKNSQRRFCNPETFAAFIGALARMGFEDVLCTGMSFEDATSYPSVTHPNGDSVDTSYFSTIEKEQKKVDAFHFFKFKNIYRGKLFFYSKLKNSIYMDRHEDHLHAGDFDSSIVKTIIK